MFTVVELFSLRFSREDITWRLFLMNEDFLGTPLLTG
jgi:hypothetical protein